jgi:peptidoglycan hydrolase-like protein with peptidoglycan-binding domain
VSSLSRKTVAWAAGAALAVGGGTAGIVIAAQGGGQPATGGTAVAQAAAVRPAPLDLVSVSPVSLSQTAGAQAVNGAGTIVVTYNQPIPATAPLPQLSPATTGTWRRSGDVAIFTPTKGYAAGTHVTVTVAGLGYSRNRSESSSFKTAGYSTLRLQEILAQLGYLPLTWTPASGAGISPGNANAELSAAYRPPAGTFSWTGDYPPDLKDQWRTGSGNMLDVGAVRAFESAAGLTMDGSAGHTVWSGLLRAVAKGEHNPNGYTYALTSQALPETIKIWHDGRLVLRSAVNTGIPASPTADGTFPVYLRYYFQIMRGTNPDGSQYADPVYYVSYFNGGDAVHYFARGGYGYNQSLGCVELPWDAAKKAYPYLTYGSLVTVTGPVGG